MLDQVTGMRVFLSVHAEGSFAAAARAMRLSQTMVGKHIDAIEQRLGVQLLRRSTRSLTLTEAGSYYLRSCQHILAEIEDAEEAVVAGQSQPRGHLRLNAPVSFGTLHIAPLMADFSALYPQVTIELGLSDYLVGVVQEGWDLVIRFGPLPNSNLRSRPLASCGIVVCASPGYLATHGTPQTIDDLKSFNCLGFTLAERIGVNHWTFGANGEISAPVSGNMRSNSSTALREAALAGLGIVSLPSYLVCQDLRKGNLVAIGLDHRPTPIGVINAVFADDRRMPLKTRKMIEFLAERFGKTPPWERDLDLP
ncbi:LysR family transcriptional regulator, partial [Pararhizobium mangrovi]